MLKIVFAFNTLCYNEFAESESFARCVRMSVFNYVKNNWKNAEIYVITRSHRIADISKFLNFPEDKIIQYQNFHEIGQLLQTLKTNEKDWIILSAFRYRSFGKMPSKSYCIEVCEKMSEFREEIKNIKKMIFGVDDYEYYLQNAIEIKSLKESSQ